MGLNKNSNICPDLLSTLPFQQNDLTAAASLDSHYREYFLGLHCQNDTTRRAIPQASTKMSMQVTTYPHKKAPQKKVWSQRTPKLTARAARPSLLRRTRAAGPPEIDEALPSRHLRSPIKFAEILNDWRDLRGGGGRGAKDIGTMKKHGYQYNIAIDRSFCEIIGQS